MYLLLLSVQSYQKQEKVEPVVVAHACNFNTWETETGRAKKSFFFFSLFLKEIVVPLKLLRKELL